MRTLIVTPVGNEDPAEFKLWLQEVDRELNERIQLLCLTDQHTDPPGLRMLIGGPYRRWENINSSGLASLYRAGLTRAARYGFDNVILMDVGHSPSLIQPMHHLLYHVDMVCASRFMAKGEHKGSLLRRTISDIGTIIAHDFLGMKMTDCTGGFVAMRVNKIPQLETAMVSRSYGFFLELKYLCRDLPWTEIPLRYYCNRSGFRLTSLLDGLRVVAYHVKRRLTCSR